jgi:flagellar motor component MotA
MNNKKSRNLWLKILLLIIGSLLFIVIGLWGLLYLQGPAPVPELTKIYTDCIVSVKQKIHEKDELQKLREFLKMGDKIKPGGSERLVTIIAEEKCKKYFVKSCSMIFNNAECKNTLKEILKSKNKNT